MVDSWTHIYITGGIILMLIYLDQDNDLFPSRNSPVEKFILFYFTFRERSTKD